MFKPLLAAKADLDKITFPIMASPKIDGIRCIWKDGVAYSRTMKPIPNKFVQSRLLEVLLDRGLANMELDGELITMGSNGMYANFSGVSSAIMSREGEPDFDYMVFDTLSFTSVFKARYRWLESNIGLHWPYLKLVPHLAVRDAQQLQAVFDKHVEQGYEGTMLRRLDGRYKQGRSTVNEGILLKHKLFDDAEFEVVGFNELMVNQNEAYKNDVGATKRSTDRSGLVPGGVLGTLTFEKPNFTGPVGKLTDHDFDVGTGFTSQQRHDLWQERDTLVGRVAKIKYQGIGSQGAPRFPVFLGFRDQLDM